MVGIGRFIFGGNKEEGRGGIGRRGGDKKGGGNSPGNDNGPRTRAGVQISNLTH